LVIEMREASYAEIVTLSQSCYLAKPAVIISPQRFFMRNAVKARGIKQNVTTDPVQETWKGHTGVVNTQERISWIASWDGYI